MLVILPYAANITVLSKIRKTSCHAILFMFLLHSNTSGLVMVQRKCKGKHHDLMTIVANLLQYFMLYFL